MGVGNNALPCPHCGARRIVEGSRFCDICGQSILRPSRTKTTVKTRKEKGEVRVPVERRIEALVARPVLEPVEAPRRVEQVIPQPQVVEKMKVRHARAPAYGPRWLGAAFVAFGLLTVVASVVVGVVSLGGMGLASFLIGLLLIYLPSRASVAPELVEASVLSSLANMERVLLELGPETKAVYLKIADRLDVPLIFLPLDDNPAPATQISASELDTLLVMDAKDSHRTGLVLQAPGASLLAFMEKESGVNFMDVSREDLLDALRSGLVESLEAVADVKGEFAGNGLKLRIRDGALGSLSRSVAKSAPCVASRMGCPICSAAICGTVKALKRDIVLEEAEHPQGFHNVTLNFL